MTMKKNHFFFSKTKYVEIRVHVFYYILNDLLEDINNKFLDTTLEIIGAVSNFAKLQSKIMILIQFRKNFQHF